MKKTFTALLFLSVFHICIYGQFTHIGIAGGYGTSIKEPGFGLYGMYTINEQIKITPNLMYYLPHEITTNDGTQTFSWWTVNLDGNYVILDREAFQAYGVMGFSLIYLEGDRDEQPNFQYKDHFYKMGLNVGAGIRLPISDKVAPFAEVKMTLGDKVVFDYRKVSTTQLVIKAGILIRIAPDKDRESEDF